MTVNHMIHNSNDDKDFDFCPNLWATVCNFTSTSWIALQMYIEDLLFCNVSP